MDERFPQPKKNPLRPVPDSLEKQTETILISSGKKVTRALVASAPSMQYECVVDEDAVLVLSIPPHHIQDAYLSLFVTLKKNARCEVEQRVVSQHTSITTMVFALEGEGAHAQVHARFHGTKDQHLGLFMIMHHKVPNTTGDIAIRAVHEQQSRGVYSGLIKIEKQAQKTLSYFKDDVLLLDEGLAESLPTLEIEANDVKASHGSTTSRVSEEQLFYLQSRGISRARAREMIIEGFLRFAK